VIKVSASFAESEGRTCRGSIKVRPLPLPPSQLTASEQVIDQFRDAGRRALSSRQGQPAGGHSTSADRRDVVAAGLAGVVAVDLAAQRVGQERAIDDQLLGR